MSDRLRLRATDGEDLGVLSAVLQDGLVTFRDMQFLADERRFVLVVNRFCWERGPGSGRDPVSYERVHCGVCFENVKSVRLRNLDRRARSQVHALLAVKQEEDTVDLLFAGRGRVRLEVEGILCHLQDLDDPWPTRWRPRHPGVEDG